MAALRLTEVDLAEVARIAHGAIFHILRTLQFRFGLALIQVRLRRGGEVTAQQEPIFLVHNLVLMPVVQRRELPVRLLKKLAARRLGQVRLVLLAALVKGRLRTRVVVVAAGPPVLLALEKMAAQMVVFLVVVAVAVQMAVRVLLADLEEPSTVALAA
jgi:hypothetical protein